MTSYTRRATRDEDAQALSALMADLLSAKLGGLESALLERFDGLDRRVARLEGEIGGAMAATRERVERCEALLSSQPGSPDTRTAPSRASTTGSIISRSASGMSR